MKEKVTISVDGEHLRKVRKFCELTGFPFSRLFQDHMATIAGLADQMRMDEKKRLSKLDILRLLRDGILAKA